jgi:hypothetical protein
VQFVASHTSRNKSPGPPTGGRTVVPFHRRVHASAEFTTCDGFARRPSDSRAAAALSPPCPVCTVASPSSRSPAARTHHSFTLSRGHHERRLRTIRCQNQFVHDLVTMAIEQARHRNSVVRTMALLGAARVLSSIDGEEARRIYAEGVASAESLALTGHQRALVLHAA